MEFNLTNWNLLLQMSNSLIISAKLSCSLLNALHIPQHRGLKVFSIVFLPLCNFLFAVFRFLGFIKILKSDRKNKKYAGFKPTHSQKLHTKEQNISLLENLCNLYCGLKQKKVYCYCGADFIRCVGGVSPAQADKGGHPCQLLFLFSIYYTMYALVHQ